MAMGVATDGLNRLFSNRSDVLRLVRDVGLGLVDRLPALKRLFIREAAGLGRRRAEAVAGRGAVSCLSRPRMRDEQCRRHRSIFRHGRATSRRNRRADARLRAGMTRTMITSAGPRRRDAGTRRAARSRRTSARDSASPAGRDELAEAIGDHADRNVADGEGVAGDDRRSCRDGRRGSSSPSVVFCCEVAIAAMSRFSGGVRIRPQNAAKIAGPATGSCQSIHWLARARAFGSAGSSVPAPCLPAR